MKTIYTGLHWFLRVDSDGTALFLRMEDLEKNAYCFTPSGQRWWKTSDWLYEQLQKNDGNWKNIFIQFRKKLKS